MRINYLKKHSKFLRKCEDRIRQNKEVLLTGAPISFEFLEAKKSGYKGNIHVNIEKTNPESFWTDWEYTDSTRFPARIKAAAYALFMNECFGKFVISHNTGILKIHLDCVVENSKTSEREDKQYNIHENERKDSKYPFS